MLKLQFDSILSLNKRLIDFNVMWIQCIIISEMEQEEKDEEDGRGEVGKVKETAGKGKMVK